MKKILPRITDARYIAGHIIRLRVSDGAEREVDLFSELYGEVFEPLKEVGYFRKFQLHPTLRRIVWPNGADFAPEFLGSLLKVAA